MTCHAAFSAPHGETLLPFWGEEEILNLIFAKGRDLSGICAQSDKVLF